MKVPMVSVIIPLYNHEKYIRKAIESVLEQRIQDIELIVINDGSTDGSEEVVRSIRDDRIIVHSHVNRGAAYSINQGISLARGEYVSILNSDDIYYPDRFSVFLECMAEYPDIAAVFSQVEMIDEDGTILEQNRVIQKYSGGLVGDSSHEVYQAILNLLAGNFLITTSNLFCKKDIFNHIGLFQDYRYAHDYDFFLRLAYHYPVKIMNVPLLRYRVHSKNTIRQKDPEVAFEVASILSEFLYKYDFSVYWPNQELQQVMLQLYDSLNTFQMDRATLIMVLMGAKYGVDVKKINELNPENAFRKQCMEDWTANQENFFISQEGWVKWRETNGRLMEAEKKLIDAHEEITRVYSESQEGWVKWRETNDRLMEAEKKLIHAHEEITRLYFESQKAWATWSKTNDRLMEAEINLRGAYGEIETKNDQIESLTQACSELKKRNSTLASQLEAHQKSLQEILSSRTYKSGTIIRDAGSSLKGLVLMPFRLVYLLLPRNTQQALNPIADWIRKWAVGNRVNRKQIQSVKNVRWPSSRPFVSVIITCYNYGKYIEEAIYSVLQQTFPSIEIIVVNDGSDDPETIGVLQNLNSRNLRIIHQKNLGLPAARNRGVRKAKGKYICCLDADDMILPTYVEKCVYRMETEGYDICGCLQENFGEERALLRPEEFGIPQLFESNRMINAALYRKSLWENAGGYDEKMTLGYEDWEFWIRTASLGARAIVLNESLFRYRKHGPSMIDSTITRHNEILEYIKNKHKQIVCRFVPEKIQVENPLINLGVEKFGSRNETAVLVVMPFLTIGGAETIMSRIIRHLKEKNYRIVLVTTDEALPEMGDSLAWFTCSISEIYNLPCFLERHAWKGFIFYLIESRQIQLIWHLGSSFFYELLPEIKSFHPSVFVIDMLFNTVGHTASNRKYNYCIDVIFTENAEVKNWLIQHGESPERIYQIPNGVDTSFYTPLAAKSLNIVKQFDLDVKKIIGYIGRFSHEKGPDLFIDIAHKLSMEKSCGFLMVGGGPMLNEILDKLKNSRSLNIKYLGMVFDVRDCLGSCDILVVPSRLDGRPNVVLQAMAMGVPVVASRIGALPEIIVDGENGYLCDVNQVEHFVERIRQIALDEKLHESMKQKSRQYAEQFLDEANLLCNVESILRNSRFLMHTQTDSQS